MISLLSGNSRILLTVDERGGWAQLYFPYPGLHQQLQQTRVGLFDEATKDFSWVDQEGDPPVEAGYLEESNVARTRLQRLGLDVVLDDMVHPNLDLIVRRITLRNPGPRSRRMRVFHYQSLNIAGSLYQGTAYWDADRKTVNHYKGSYYFQIQGQPEFSHFSCGEHTLKGLQGSYVDAEDGQLGGNPISHGAADSVVQWDLEVPSGQERSVHLLVMIGRSRRQVNEMFRHIGDRDPALFTAECVGYGNHWARHKQVELAPGLSQRARDIYRRSLFVMRDCQAASGAILASPDSRTLKWGGDTYTYNWWRDSAYVAKAMSEAGLYRNAMQLINFAGQCQEEEGYFLHRHLPDGSLGSTWHPPPFLQVDQTASVIDAIHHQYEESGNLDELLQSWQTVRKAADFLMTFVDARGLPRPSFDLWEEKKTVNAYTVAAVVRGLNAAARIGKALAKRSEFWSEAAARMHQAALEHLWNPRRNTFYKSIDPVDDTVDASTLLALLIDFLPPTDPRFAQVVKAVEERLWVQGPGGIARYEGDQYYGPENPWVICTLWLAQCHLKLGNPERARELIEWAAGTASATDLLPEQIESQSGEHTSVTPLVWSHSTFVEAVHAYSRRPVREAPRAEAASIVRP
jgi:alpha,alpha-trehalase